MAPIPTLLPVEDLWKAYLSVLLNLAGDLKPMAMDLKTMALFRVGIRGSQKFELMKVVIALVPNGLWTNL